VSGLSGATQITAGDAHTCALLEGGSAKCWGSNASGRLGDGTTTQRLTPVESQIGPPRGFPWATSVTAAPPSGTPQTTPLTLSISSP